MGTGVGADSNGASIARVADLEAIERELDIARKREDNDARVRLITRAISLPEATPHLADYLDELAYAYQQLGRFDDAVDTMRQAVAAGWDGDLDEHPSASALIADLLLRAGRTEEADDAWLAAEREDPLDPWLYQSAGCAYMDTELHDKALPWQTTGLELALDAVSDDEGEGEGEGDMVWLITGDRAETLEVLGHAPDELQLRAEALVERLAEEEQARIEQFEREHGLPAPVPPHLAAVGLAWFPAGEYQRAMQMWSSFAEDYEHGPYESYCARLELLLRTLTSQGVARLALVPIAIADYLSWCAEHDADPEASASRARYATELLEHGTAHPWPPDRNRPCWCGSQRKYKKCCLRAA